jgi:2Fe-2S ferredoxin
MCSRPASVPGYRSWSVETIVGRNQLIRITYVTAGGERTTLDANDGASLMMTAVTGGIEGIIGECGGGAMCATCHVYVDDAYLDRLPVRSEVEEQMLEGTASRRRENSRLSCQIKAEAGIDGIVLHIPETQI